LGGGRGEIQGLDSKEILISATKIGVVFGDIARVM